MIEKKKLAMEKFELFLDSVKRENKDEQFKEIQEILNRYKTLDDSHKILVANQNQLNRQQ